MGKQNKEASQNRTHRRVASSPEELAEIIENHLRHATGGEVHLSGFQLHLASPDGEISVNWKRGVHGARLARQDSNGHGQPYSGTTITGTFVREDD